MNSQAPAKEPALQTDPSKDSDLRTAVFQKLLPAHSTKLPKPFPQRILGNDYKLR